MVRAGLGLAAAAAALSVAGAAQALTVAHSYEFETDGSDALGGPSMVVAASSSYVPGGIRYAADEGPNVSGAFASDTVHSVEFYGSIDVMGRFVRLLDYENGTSDYGPYMTFGQLNYYGTSQYYGGPVFSANTPLHFVFTSSDTAFGIYIQGQLIASGGPQPRLNFTTPNRILRFFDDDGGPGETSSGFLDFVRLYDEALTQADVTRLYNGGDPLRLDDLVQTGVPEPGTWALMILGFGAAGAMLRRRRLALA
jgi:hypothetical protein